MKSEFIIKVEEKNGLYDISIPLDIPEAGLKFLESYLNSQRKIVNGHYITSLKGFLNKFKFYFMGYALVKKTELQEGSA